MGTEKKGNNMKISEEKVVVMVADAKGKKDCGKKVEDGGRKG